MRRGIIVMLAVALSAGTAQAQVGLDLMYGFLQAKSIFLASSTASTLEMKGGSSFSAGGLELWMGSRDSTVNTFVIGVSGFKATSSAPIYTSDALVQAELDAKVLFVTGWGRRYLTQMGRQSRVFVETGGGLCNMDASIKASVGVFSASETGSSNKGCVGGGIGFHHRMNKTFVLLGRARYVKVLSLDGEFDPSQFTALIGVGIGG
jgi:hypothetical protein